MTQSLQTIIKLVLALVIALLALQAFKIIMGGVFLIIKLFFFLGLCAVAYLVVNTVWNSKSTTN